MLPSRRTLLLGAGATAALAAVAAYPALRQLGAYPPLTQDLKHLGPKSAAVYAIIGDFIVPPGGALPGSGGDAVTLSRIDRLLQRTTDDMRFKLQALPLVFEHGTALDRFGARSLFHLPKDRQHTSLKEWAESTDATRAQLWMAVRSVFVMAYFEREDVVRAMGIAPGCG